MAQRKKICQTEGTITVQSVVGFSWYLLSKDTL